MIIIGLGANLPGVYGLPAQTIAEAKNAIMASGIKILKSSRIWLTAPVPASDQPWYHNAVIQAETFLEPFDLLSVLQKIESDFGRTRKKRNEARVIDLDLIAYNQAVIDEDVLVLPHPRMHERAFVLMPLREIAPDWCHPVSGETLEGMIFRLPEEQKAAPLEE
jgi:2-amino-4-hydroxy-6-hydroxymethyldihydropteridine diphosphokinase